MSGMQIGYRPIQGNLARIAHLLQREEYEQLQTQELYGIAAFDGEAPIGLLLYQKNGNTLWLSRVFVSGGYRRMAVGTAMLELLCKYVDASGQELMVSFDGETIGDRFYRFLASTHAFYIERVAGFEAYLTKDEIAEICRQYAKGSGKAVRFFDRGRQQQREFIEDLKESYPEIAWELEQDAEQYRRDLCYCVVDKNSIQSVSLVKENNGLLEMKLLYSRPGKGVLAAVALMDSIAALAQAEPMPLSVSAVNEASVRIVDQICPNYQITKRFYIAYYIGKKQKEAS